MNGSVKKFWTTGVAAVTAAVICVAVASCGDGFDCAKAGEACVNADGAEEVGLDCCEGLQCFEQRSGPGVCR